MTFSIGKHILWSGHHVSSLKTPQWFICFLLHTQEIFRNGSTLPPERKKRTNIWQLPWPADSGKVGKKSTPTKLWKLDTKKRPGGWRKSPRDESTATIEGGVNSHCFPMVGMVINLIVGVYNGPIICKDSLWKVGWPSPYIRSLFTLAHLVPHIKASCGSIQYQKTHAFLVQIFCGRFWSMSSRRHDFERSFDSWKWPALFACWEKPPPFTMHFWEAPVMGGWFGTACFVFLVGKAEMWKHLTP